MAETEKKEGKAKEPPRVARIARGDLRGLDELGVESLALPLFAVVKQPLGAAGFVDWRLSGRLGRLLLQHRFEGALGEALLMSSLGRIGPKRIFLLGLGDVARAMDDVRARMVRAIAVLADAGARSIAVAPPVLPGEVQPSRESLSVRLEASKPAQSNELAFGARAMIEWVEAAKQAAKPFEELVLLDADGSLARAETELAEAAKKSGFVWQ